MRMVLNQSDRKAGINRNILRKTKTETLINSTSRQKTRRVNSKDNILTAGTTKITPEEFTTNKKSSTIKANLVTKTAINLKDQTHRVNTRLRIINRKRCFRMDWSRSLMKTRVISMQVGNTPRKGCTTTIARVIRIWRNRGGSPESTSLITVMAKTRATMRPTLRSTGAESVAEQQNKTIFPKQF